LGFKLSSLIPNVGVLKHDGSIAGGMSFAHKFVLLLESLDLDFILMDLLIGRREAGTLINGDSK